MRFILIPLAIIILIIVLSYAFDSWRKRRKKFLVARERVIARMTPGKERYKLLVEEKSLKWTELDEYYEADPTVLKFVKETLELTGDYGLASLCGQYGRDKIARGQV